jgi:uncharacterized membrane protein
MNEIGTYDLDYNEIRMDFMPKIMLGLEFLCDDLLRSIIAPSLNETITLAIIICIVIGYSISSREQLRIIHRTITLAICNSSSKDRKDPFSRNSSEGLMD